MAESTSHIDFELIAKYLAGECTREEALQLEEWIQLSENNRLEFEAVKDIWAASDEVEVNTDVDAAWEKISLSVEDAQTPKASHNSWLRIAAGVAAVVGISIAIWFSNPPQELQMVESTHGVLAFDLADGSMITLQEGSSLEYPASFDDAQREVTLKGTGFFEITPNKEKPFIVHTDAGDVRVLGTSFEVSTTQEETQLSIEVLEGLVQVSNTDQTSVAKVAAGQVCSLNTKNQVEVEEIAHPAPFFWKDRTIKFKRTSLKQVVTTITDLMQVEIVLDNSDIEHCELTATFEDESAESMLEIIAITLGLELKKTDGKYTLSGEKC